MEWRGRIESTLSRVPWRFARKENWFSTIHRHRRFQRRVRRYTEKGSWRRALEGLVMGFRDFKSTRKSEKLDDFEPKSIGFGIQLPTNPWPVGEVEGRLLNNCQWEGGIRNCCWNVLIIDRLPLDLQASPRVRWCAMNHSGVQVGPNINYMTCSLS